MSCNSCTTGNNGGLWILILALVLSGQNINLENLLDGCGTPLLLALLYCTYKNGSLGNLVNSLFGNNCSCGCG